MKTYEIRQELEARTIKGLPVTKAYVKSLSLKLLQYCLEKASLENVDWKSILHKTLYGIPKCKQCGSLDVVFKTFTQGFRTFCSCTCARLNPKVNEKFRKTMKSRYGVEYSGQSQALRRKAEETCIKTYGRAYRTQFRKTSEQTMLKRYGAKNVMQVPEFRKKFENTMVDRYGAAHALQCVKFKRKSVKTSLKNWRVLHPMQHEDVRKTLESAMLEKYGVRHNWAHGDLREATREVMLRLYGVEHSSLASPEIKRRYAKTMMKLYGVASPKQSLYLAEKIRKTMLKRYGSEYALQSKELKEKVRRTMRKRYGVDYAMQNPESFEKNQIAAYARKKVVLGGKTFFVQGYEPNVLKYLVHRLGCDPNEILHTHEEGRPSVQYAKGTRMYHPDLYAKVKGRWYIIEVKSTYTLLGGKNDTMYARVREKAKACLEAGFRFRLVVSDPKTNSVSILQDLHEKTKRQVTQELQRLLPATSL